MVEDPGLGVSNIGSEVSKVISDAARNQADDDILLPAEHAFSLHYTLQHSFNLY